MEKSTEIIIICMDCKKFMGKKDGQGESGITHSLCPECATIFRTAIAVEKKLLNELNAL